jgi:hypothetical protein
MSNTGNNRIKSPQALIIQKISPDKAVNDQQSQSNPGSTRQELLPQIFDALVLDEIDRPADQESRRDENAQRNRYWPVSELQKITLGTDQ